MNFAIVLVRILVVIALIVGICFGCYFLFFKTTETTSALQRFDDIQNSADYETFLDKVNEESSNGLLQYGTTVTSNYEEALALYQAEWQVACTFVPEIYFSTADDAISTMNNLFADYAESIKLTNNAVAVFFEDKTAFGNSPTTIQQQTLLNEFKFVATRLTQQANILISINDLLVPVVRDEIYGGASDVQYNIKYLVTEALYKQANTLQAVLNNSEETVGAKLLQNTNQILAKFKIYQSVNFSRANNPSLNDDFLLSYSNINKEQFFNAIDKYAYYTAIDGADETKPDVLVVLTYFGFTA